MEHSGQKLGHWGHNLEVDVGILTTSYLCFLAAVSKVVSSALCHHVVAVLASCEYSVKKLGITIAMIANNQFLKQVCKPRFSMFSFKMRLLSQGR